MSITMLSTSTLNALGYEKQTFIFYFVGAFGSLLCNLILPAHLGAFAYIFSLFISFLLTGFCNLFFLSKTCPKLFPTFFKTAGKKLALSCLLILPVSLFGMVCLWIFRQFFGAIPVLFFTGFATLLFSVFLHATLSLFPKIPIKNKKK
jgi:O-antigen/teichoic acid export membrane protein